MAKGSKERDAAEAWFQNTQKRRVSAAHTETETEKQAHAVTDNTARLRSLRLAKETADKQSGDLTKKPSK